MVCSAVRRVNEEIDASGQSARTLYCSTGTSRSVLPKKPLLHDDADVGAIEAKVEELRDHRGQTFEFGVGGALQEVGEKVLRLTQVHLFEFEEEGVPVPLRAELEEAVVYFA